MVGVQQHTFGETPLEQGLAEVIAEIDGEP